MSGPPHLIAYSDAMRRGDHEEAARVMDQNDVDERASFDHYMRVECGRPDLADRHAARMKEIDSGRDQARRTWHVLSAVQKRALECAKLIRIGVRWVGKSGAYSTTGEYEPQRFTTPTLRNLCARGLMAWDGGASDPEAAAVLTERGRFVLAWGPTPDPTDDKET